MSNVIVSLIDPSGNPDPSLAAYMAVQDYAAILAEELDPRDDPHAEHGDWQTPNVHACCDGNIETQITKRHEPGTPYMCPHCQQPYCADCDIEVQR